MIHFTVLGHPGPQKPLQLQSKGSWLLLTADLGGIHVMLILLPYRTQIFESWRPKEDLKGLEKTPKGQCVGHQDCSQSALDSGTQRCQKCGMSAKESCRT